MKSLFAQKGAYFARFSMGTHIGARRGVRALQGVCTAMQKGKFSPRSKNETSEMEDFR